MQSAAASTPFLLSSFSCSCSSDCNSSTKSVALSRPSKVAIALRIAVWPTQNPPPKSPKIEPLPSAWPNFPALEEMATTPPPKVKTTPLWFPRAPIKAAIPSSITATCFELKYFWQSSPITCSPLTTPYNPVKLRYTVSKSW